MNKRRQDTRDLLREMHAAVTRVNVIWHKLQSHLGYLENGVADSKDVIVDGGNVVIPDGVTLGELDETVIALAKASQGEGAAYFGTQRDAVGLWIGHCAMNRLESGWWDDQFESQAEQVEDAFHGCVNVPGEPQEWALRLATLAYCREEDIADGTKFMLSRADIKALGPLTQAPVRVFENDQGHQLQFFKLWPAVGAN